MPSHHQRRQNGDIDTYRSTAKIEKIPEETELSVVGDNYSYSGIDQSQWVLVEKSQCGMTRPHAQDWGHEPRRYEMATWLQIILTYLFYPLQLLHEALSRCVCRRPLKYTYLWRVEIEVLRSGRWIRQGAVALIDTGCPKNLMSREFARKLGNPFRNHGTVTLETPAGGNFTTIGQISGTWFCREKPHSRFTFPPKFLDAVWEVADIPAEFDVIFGRETINKYRLVGRPMFAAPAAFRAKHKVDKATEAERKKQEQERKENLKKETQDREKKQREQDIRQGQQ